MAAAQTCGDLFCACGCGAWLGQCCRPAPARPYLMPALSDREDDPPHQRSRLPFMSTEHDDDRPETIPAEAPSSEREAPTNPHAAREPMLPPADESYFAATARDFAASLVEMRATRKDIADGFKKQEASAKRTRADVAKAAKVSKANDELLRHEFTGLRESLGTFRRETEERFTALENEIRQLRARLDSQEADLNTTKRLIADVEEQLRNDAAARAQAPAAPTA